MRLAALMHRTVEELHETMSVAEWNRWLLFHSLYDLPDSFLVAGQLGALISRIVGGKGNPEDFAPYYKVDVPSPRHKVNDMKPAFAFLAACAKDREESGRPLGRNARKGAT